MKELSLNILDIVQNSVKAEATLIEIIIDENIDDDKLTIVVSDNGCGMSPEFLSRVRDPFTTTRTTRRVGMGIPLLNLPHSRQAEALRLLPTRALAPVSLPDFSIIISTERLSAIWQEQWLL